MYVLYYVFHRFDIEYLVFDLCHCLITSQAISNAQFKIACVYADPRNYEGFLLLITDVLCENDGSVHTCPVRVSKMPLKMPNVWSFQVYLVLLALQRGTLDHPVFSTDSIAIDGTDSVS